MLIQKGVDLFLSWTSDASKYLSPWRGEAGRDDLTAAAAAAAGRHPSYTRGAAPWMQRRIATLKADRPRTVSVRQ